LQVIDHMNSTNTKPVTRTYNTLMIACNTSGQWQEALNVYGEMVRLGHSPNTTTFNALISAHSKAGRLEKVGIQRPGVSIADEGLQPSQEVVGCGLRVVFHVLNVYGEMVRLGHSPNTTTFNALISAHSKAGRLEKVGIWRPGVAG
jgi:pentatricopeptide repeat domain-containing protein 1